MITNLLLLHLLVILLGLPLWRQAHRHAEEAGTSPALALGTLLFFGIVGYYAVMIGQDAHVRKVRGGMVWFAVALVVALLPEILFTRGLMGLGFGFLAWILFHVGYSLLRPKVTVDQVEARARALKRWEDPGTSLLQAEGLKKHFPIKGGMLNRVQGAVRAVDGVSFALNAGETLGLVGESGCGKSTLGRVVMRLLESTEGSVRYRGIDLGRLAPAELQAIRKEIQIVFQDPYSSLNPRLTVESMLREALSVHGLATGAAAGKRVGELLERVGLSAYHARRYPHEFSGGQRQRLGIARALAVEPKLIVCDEPVSALDVSVQAQIVNLLMDLQRDLGLTYIFIAHDLNVVEHISDRVAVMYLGRIVELADRDAIYENPRHPYTRALLSAIPIADPSVSRKRTVLGGDVPSPANPPTGCRFHPRCPEATEACQSQSQKLAEVGAGHLVACHRSGELPPWEAVTLQDTPAE